jgi:hypothetical protein
VFWVQQGQSLLLLPLLLLLLQLPSLLLPLLPLLLVWLISWKGRS